VRALLAVTLAIAVAPLALALAPVMYLQGVPVTPARGLGCDCLFLADVERFRAAYVPLLMAATAAAAYSVGGLASPKRISLDALLLLLVALTAASLNASSALPAPPPLAHDMVGAVEVLVYLGEPEATPAFTMIAYYPAAPGFLAAYTAARLYLVARGNT